VHPVLWATVVTGILSAVFWLALFHHMAGPNPKLAWVALLGLPLSLAVNLGVKGPIYRGVASLADVSPEAALAAAPVWFLVFRLLLSPLAEEGVKVAPLAFPGLRRHLAGPGGALWLGVYLGIGFGLGEVGYVGWRLSASEALANYPVWMFTGFLGERLAGTCAHGIMTGAFLVLACRGGAGWLAGYFAAVGLHTLANLGALLARVGVVTLGQAQIWFYGIFVLMLLLFLRLHHRVAVRSPGRRRVLFRRPSE
jgi:hypothetical protein